MRTVKQVERNRKETREFKKKKEAENQDKFDQAMKHKNEEAADLKEKRRELDQKYQQNEEQVAKRKQRTREQQM